MKLCGKWVLRTETCRFIPRLRRADRCKGSARDTNKKIVVSGNMASQSLQKVVVSVMNNIEDRFSRIENSIQDIERRVIDLETVMYELTGGDTQSEVSFASTCKYVRPSNK